MKKLVKSLWSRDQVFFFITSTVRSMMNMVAVEVWIAGVNPINCKHSFSVLSIFLLRHTANENQLKTYVMTDTLSKWLSFLLHNHLPLP